MRYALPWRPPTRSTGVFLLVGGQLIQAAGGQIVSGKFVVRVVLIAALTMVALKWAGQRFGIAPLIGL